MVRGGCISGKDRENGEGGIALGGRAFEKCIYGALFLFGCMIMFELESHIPHQ